jgi:RNA polymerase sigma factor (sigma-70 family)
MEGVRPVADGALLAAFIDTRSEEAFNEIVRQHIGMVYAVCRRQLRDAHHAEDVTQAVFVLLARKAESLPPDVVLGGWLYRTAVYACSNARSLQRTRAYHENRVTPMNTPSESADDPVSRMEMESLLDEGLMQLSNAQREVIVLRFFQEKTLAEVAEARQQSLHATQKSLNAGMANLRRYLSQRGVVVSLGAVGALLAAQSAKAVPAGLAVTVNTAALHGSHALSAPVAQLVARLANHVGYAKLLASLATAALLIAIGIHFLPSATANTPKSIATPSSITAPIDHQSDLAALQETLQQANTALRDMNLPALSQLLAFRDPAQSADWQRMAPLFEADLALRRAALSRFGPNAPRLTAIQSFSDRLDQLLPTIDDQHATWSIDDDTASLHFTYRNDPRTAALFFLKTDGQWRIDATRSAEVALEGLTPHNTRAPLHNLTAEEQSRLLTKIDHLHHSLTETAARITAGQLTDPDEARQELQLAAAQSDARAFFRFALRTDDDQTTR